jgi:predicted nucleic acid-binding protein
VIVADSSVWIDLLRGRDTPKVDMLTVAAAQNRLLVLDIVLLEVLLGAGSEAHSARIERDLGEFPIASALNPQLARLAARNYRTLRDLGITIRKTPDLIIGAYCIANDHALLHADRDFEPMARHLGLRIA